MATRNRASFGYLPSYSQDSIADLAEVDISTLSDGQTLAWNSAQNRWIPASSGPNATLPDGTGSGDILSWNGAEWAANPPPGPGVIVNNGTGLASTSNFSVSEVGAGVSLTSVTNGGVVGMGSKSVTAGGAGNTEVKAGANTASNNTGASVELLGGTATESGKATVAAGLRSGHTGASKLTLNPGTAAGAGEAVLSAGENVATGAHGNLTLIAPSTAGGTAGKIKLVQGGITYEFPQLSHGALPTVGHSLKVKTASGTNVELEWSL